MSTAHPTLLDVHQLQPNPLQPRGKIKKIDLEELVTSIKSYGILEPIIVAQTPAGYQIIAGERRWRAAQVVGLSQVPVIIKTTTPRGMLEMALIENVQRVDLSPIERAQAFLQLLRDFRFSHQQVADRIGKSVSYVTNTMRLLELPDAVKDGLTGGQISEGHARALGGLPTERLIVDVYKEVLRNSSSVRETEELVRRAKNTLELSPKRQGRISAPIKNLDQWEHRFQQVLGEKSQVQVSQSVRQTRLVVTLRLKPEAAQEKLAELAKLFGESQD